MKLSVAHSQNKTKKVSEGEEGTEPRTLLPGRLGGEEFPLWEISGDSLEVVSWVNGTFRGGLWPSCKAG